MKPADLDITDLAADLLHRAEKLNNSMSSVITAILEDEGEFEIVTEYENGFVDHDSYLVDTDGNIYIASTPLGLYKVATLGEDTCDDVSNNLLQLTKEVQEHLKYR